MNTLAGIVLFLIAVITSHEAMARDLTLKEKAIIVKAVKRDLVDPESARFKWVKLAPEINTKDALAWYCGLVNSKNSFGGYVGDAPFAVLVAWKNGKPMPTSVVLQDHPEVLCSPDGITDLSSAE